MAKKTGKKKKTSTKFPDVLYAQHAHENGDTDNGSVGDDGLSWLVANYEKDGVTEDVRVGVYTLDRVVVFKKTTEITEHPVAK